YPAEVTFFMRLSRGRDADDAAGRGTGGLFAGSSDLDTECWLFPSRGEETIDGPAARGSVRGARFRRGRGRCRRLRGGRRLRGDGRRRGIRGNGGHRRVRGGRLRGDG